MVSTLSNPIPRSPLLLLQTNIVQTTSGRRKLVTGGWSPDSLRTRLTWRQIKRNGRWRSLYIFDPASSSIEGSIKVDVHYYEDGNVRLLTDKPVTASVSSGTGSGIAKEISTTEKKYQDELNKGFVSLSEGAFKGLRRQLPVTRQKIEWDKVTGYRLGQDISGGNGKR